MQEKTWYYEKWVGRQAAFSPSRYVNTELFLFTLQLTEVGGNLTFFPHI